MLGSCTYRLPDASKATCIGGEVRIIDRLENIREQQGYLVAPFDCDRHKILLIEPYIMKHISLEDCFFESKQELNVISESPYLQAFEVFHDAVANGPFHKLVLSRAMKMGSVGLQTPEDLFLKACSRYPHQMVTLFDTEESGAWLVITPEILVSAGEYSCRTMALAGTMAADTSEKWSQKNRQEQRIVSDYINLTLAPFASDMRITGPYSVKAGGVQHLRTDFEFALKKEIGLGSVLSALHPTPAVCGLPKKEAMKFILDNEGYDREYYSGFSGPLNIEGHTDLFVTLRCARIEGQYATLFAGGGIMPESELRSEELETRIKMETVKGVM